MIITDSNISSVLFQLNGDIKPYWSDYCLILEVIENY